MVAISPCVKAMGEAESGVTCATLYANEKEETLQWVRISRCLQMIGRKGNSGSAKSRRMIALRTVRILAISSTSQKRPAAGDRCSRNTVASTASGISKSAVENGFQIVDEYGTFYTWAEFEERVVKFAEDRPDAISHLDYEGGRYRNEYYKDPDGCEFSKRPFS